MKKKNEVRKRAVTEKEKEKWKEEGGGEKEEVVEKSEPKNINTRSEKEAAGVAPRIPALKKPLTSDFRKKKTATKKETVSLGIVERREGKQGPAKNKKRR